ncbi:hypothetical protein ACFY3G_02890 [Streptomyces phaeochromogenes]|uniref:hypothetical protein n=1 Tax=Streptomyces phaeochromogenes TaxID=1923 RepID=UPI0036A724DB
MTTPPPAPCFSPADMARRPARPSAPQPEPRPAATLPTAAAQDAPSRPEELLTPGKLRDKERFRATYQRGIRLSRMTPNSRLMAHTLIWYSSHITGRINPSGQPSIDELSYATGLTIDQVKVQLSILETRGWLYFHTVNEGPNRGETTMRLAIPAHILEQIRARSAHTSR